MGEWMGWVGVSYTNRQRKGIIVVLVERYESVEIKWHL